MNLQHITFISNIGANDVVYSYAVDSDDNYNYYLLAGKVIVHRVHPACKSEPYEFYYDNITIIDINDKKKYKDLAAFYILGEKYNLTYKPFPCENYDLSLKYNRIYVIEKENGEKYNISKQEYCDIMNEFGNMNGFEPLNIMRIIRERQV